MKLWKFFRRVFCRHQWAWTGGPNYWCLKCDKWHSNDY